jgi:eukaryotic-like serine/threonine-protein kinase
MPLSSGTKLGPYEIQSPLGAGGMGEVYRARDTRLGRDVAIKILPEHLSSNPDLKARFEREAKAISALNHPHISHLYDVGSQGGTDYLVMELLEGETLADQLQKGALPQEQVLRIGAEVASALDTAHHSGVVHRDLKPGNIMLTKSGAKLMDFGVAKPVAGPAAAASHLTPTVSKPLTAAGTIVGTYQYMAPEQIEGKEADPRTDIFALGSVLYEMATGRRAFEGKSQLSVVSAILEKEPEPITRIRPLTAPALEHVVSTCLAKEPGERWQTAADVARELRWISHSSAQILTVHRRPIAKWLGAAAVGGALLIAALISAGYWQTRAMVPVNYEFYVPAPEKATLNTLGLAGSPVISPDGKQMAFLATNPEGVRSLWIRALDSPDPRLLLETEDATFPFWSPDSKQVAFFANGKLLRIASHGGVPIPICDVSEGRGGAWSGKGFIIFGARDGPLYRVLAMGGKPIAFTQLDNAKGEGSHRFPALLPHSDDFLFVAQSNHTELVAGSLQSGRRLADFPDISASVVYNDGNLLFVRGSTLFAQTFDPQRLEFKGDPLVVAEKVEFDSQFNFSILSVSNNGALIFQSGTTGSNKQLFLLDRSGKKIGVLPGSGAYVTVHLSPSSNQLLVDVAEGAPNKRAIWLYDLVAGTRTRVTFNDESTEGVWSHDGRKIAFDVGNGAAEPHVRDLVTGSETTLFSVPGESVVTDWSPGDRYLLYSFHGNDATSRYEVSAVSTTGQHNRYSLLQVAQRFPGPRLSPDGKWLAYAGLETGREEIYIVPIDFGGPQPKIGTNKWQISTDGGSLPVWSRDGKELFFTNAPGTTLYSVPLTMTEGVVHPGTVKKLFDLSTHANAFFYDVSPDGKRIYVAEAPQGSSPPLTVVTNWQARVKK